MEIDVAFFPFWKRYLNMFRESELTKFQSGLLLWMMMEYQFEGKEPENVPKSLKLAWSFLRKDLDDARVQYETRVQNGRKGGRPKKQPSKPEETGENREKVMSMSRSMSMSKSMSRSMSRSINTGSAPAVNAGVCGEKNSFGEFGWIKLTDAQYEKLVTMMGHEELNRCIVYIDELAQSTGNRSRWKDWYLILRRCHEKRWHETGCRTEKQEIPKGASGVLGPIELDAIHKLMAEDTP